MKADIALLAAASILLSHSAFAQTFIGKPVVIATGDSYTRRTGTCTDTYDNCDAAGMIPHDLSYATHLNPATKYQIAMSDNSARGGETCTTQTPHSQGVFAGSPRGLLEQAHLRINSRHGDVVSILIGINDVNLFNVSAASLKNCLRSLYQSVTSSGKKVIAMTYPGISTSTSVWAPLPGPVASANVDVVNNTIREAVAEHNASYPNATVHLAETSTAWPASDAYLYTSDGAHPTATGAIVLAREWFRKTCSTDYLPCTVWFH